MTAVEDFAFQQYSDVPTNVTLPMHRERNSQTASSSFPLVSPRSSPCNSIDLRSLPLASRLSCIPTALAARFDPSTLALAQIWTCCTNWATITKAQLETLVMRTQPMGAHLSDPQLAPFRSWSCKAGIQRSAVGMLGKVWSSGSLAVVQNLSIIPTSVHPRNKLPDDLLAKVSELAYIPVYDLRNPSAGVVACLEVMLSVHAAQETVANVISHACDLLSQFQLSLSKPSSRPPVPTALPSPFLQVMPSSPASVCSPSLSVQSIVMSPAAASAMAATALCGPRQTQQQQCYAALLEQEIQWQRNQGIKCSADKRISINSYVGKSRMLPPHTQKETTPPSSCWAPHSRNSTCSSQSAFSMNSGACSPSSPASNVQAPMSMSRTTSVRHLDILSDILP